MGNDTPLEFYAHGKLLLTGEYAVLDGALALAIPTRYGQSMTVHPTTTNGCHWKSIDSDGIVWFEAQFSAHGTILSSTPDQQSIAQTLLDILRTAQQFKPGYNPFNQHKVETRLEFPRNWGLGTSSTLLYNIAQWAEVDPVQLLRASFGGSGYDVAVAQYKNPIIYKLEGGESHVESTKLTWDFKDQLFFVHLNEKQNSKEGIALYKKAIKHHKAPLEEISKLTSQISNCTHFDTCMALFEAHERIISAVLNLPTVKTRLFPDFNGVIKSLGAWGGDFVLVGGNQEAMAYFRDKGYSTIIPFSEMIA